MKSSGRGSCEDCPNPQLAASSFQVAEAHTFLKLFYFVQQFIKEAKGVKFSHFHPTSQNLPKDLCKDMTATIETVPARGNDMPAIGVFR